MTDYQLTAAQEPCAVIRYSDKACIPPDAANRDYAEYLVWKETPGNVPDPYVPPELVSPQPTEAQLIMYDHENRLREIEGEPPLSLGDFVDKLSP
jgi:hypothetical protein